MSKVDEKEGRSLMEKPQPGPGQESGLRPPPYSSLLGSQSQPYTPVPSGQIQTPYPVQEPPDSTVYNSMSQATMDYGKPMGQPLQNTFYPPATYDPMVNRPPMNQETRFQHNTGNQDCTVYNPMGQSTMDYGRPMGQSLHNTPYVPTTYDPTANVHSMNEEARPHQTVIVSSQSANSSRNATRLRYLKIFSAIGTILVLIGVGLRVYKNSQRNKEAARHRQEEATRMELERIRNWNYDQAVQRDVNAMIDRNSNWLQSQYNSRKKRMVGQAKTEDFKDYEDFFDFENHPLMKKLLEPEKLNRHRRGSSKKNKLAGKKNKLTTRKKRIYEAKKFGR